MSPREVGLSRKRERRGNRRKSNGSIMFRNGYSSRLLNPFHSERSADESIDGKPLGKRLFEAILRNKLKDVKTLLESGADPNISLAIIRSQLALDQEAEAKAQEEDLCDYKLRELDNVFLWKKLFGETPTLVHIAVMNVYHCNSSHRDCENALKILKLLLKHGGEVGHTSNNMFLRRKMIATNPLDLALGVQRMTLWMNIEKAESAMIKAVDIMRQHHHNSSNNNKQGQPRSHSVPFELVSLQLLDRVETILFAPSQKSDITFVSSDVDYATTESVEEEEKASNDPPDENDVKENGG